MDEIINFVLFDEYDDHNVEENRRPRIIRPRINYFEIFDDVDFIRRFGIPQHSFTMLLERIQNEIQYNTDRYV